MTGTVTGHVWITHDYPPNVTKFARCTPHPRIVIIIIIAVETLSIHNESARQLLSDLGMRISESSGDARETSFLFQRISVLVQRFNAVLLHDSLPVSDFTD